MSLRQDYILRLIDELRQFVSAMLEGGGEPGRGEEALLAVLHAQQQLFQRQPAEFMGLSLAAQIDLLAHGEAPADAQVVAASERAVSRARNCAATPRQSR